MLQYRAVYPETLELLKILQKYKSLNGCFLVGGTALALHLGHRISVDLDLFFRHDFETNEILQELREDMEFVIIMQKNRNSMIINARKRHSNNEYVKVDFVKYPYPLINEIIKTNGIHLLSVEDILSMKLSAIANRGAKKDFFDIHELLKMYSLEQMFGFFSIKFPETEQFQILKSLTYFDDAEEEFNPISLNNTNWEEVKSNITDKVNSYL